MRTICACAWSLRRNATCSAPDTLRSSAKAPCPVRSRGSSTRLTGAPMFLGRVIAESAIAQPFTLAGDGADSRDDILVTGTAAEVARQTVADLDIARERVFPQEIERGHQHAGGAKPALQGVVVAERLLQRRERVDVTQALNRLDPAAVGLYRKQQAGAGALPVDQDGTGAADAVLAADMRAGKPERMTQEIAEQRSRLDQAFISRPIDDDRDGVRLGHMARDQAAATARSVKTATRCRR